MNSVKKLPQDFFKFNFKKGRGSRKDEEENDNDFWNKRDYQSKRCSQGPETKVLKCYKKESRNAADGLMNQCDIDPLKYVFNASNKFENPNSAFCKKYQK